MTHKDLNKAIALAVNEAKCRIEVARTRWEAAYGFPAAACPATTTNLTHSKYKEDIETLLVFAAHLTCEAEGRELANAEVFEEVQALFAQYQ